MKKRHWWIAAFGLFCGALALGALNYDRIPGAEILIQKMRGKATVADRVQQYGAITRARWQPYFARKGVSYPPQKLVLVGLKQEKQIQVYAANGEQPLQLIRFFPVPAASGKPGPKLRFGDMQVPEGFYRIESLNPNSAFHLALRISYPNDFDKAQAQKEGRTELGSDIMIHGSNASIGCLAMGDEVAEDLFVLAAETGREKIRVILSPVDFRSADIPFDATRPAWVRPLYAEIKTALRKLPTR